MAPIYYILVALPCTAGAIVLAVLHIYRHLLNYTEPTYQRYIVRIIFMVPVYALMSFLSLILHESSIYYNSIREIYEAWVIYNFLSLCLAWVGGPGAVVLSLTGRVLKPNCCLMTCCFPPISLDGRFIRRCKQGCLQFVILKPILVAVTFILYAKGMYHDGNFSVNQSYLYLTIIYTVSYSMALYALALFYVACRDLLQPFNPVPKFILIKSVVFLTYWQGVLVFLAAKSGFIKNTKEAADFQNFIVCVEMLIAAAGHLYAFPYKEYAGANIGCSRGFTWSLAHALKLNDFYHDTVHQFAPTYHDYVLYNHSEGEEGPKKFRSRTFVPIGQEMDLVFCPPSVSEFLSFFLSSSCPVDLGVFALGFASVSGPRQPAFPRTWCDPHAFNLTSSNVDRHLFQNLHYRSQNRRDQSNKNIMSSLAAARADNFYYPPEWSPKKGSLNNFHGQHALRERARKIDQGILIIRFEMPFNIWCGGCNSMIAKGVRFNAEKKQVGNYYSTKIWSFTMKSACCKHVIVIQTDPQNCEYVIISGAQRKNEDYDIEDAETLLLPADEDRSKLADPFYRLEHQEEDLQKKKEAEPVLVRLQRVSDARHSDDYALNKALRAQLRGQKKRVAEEETASRKLGLGIRLLPASEEDAATAARMKFPTKFDRNRKEKRAVIRSSSIFPASSSGSSSKLRSSRRQELESKRRKIMAGAASNLLVGGFKPSSLSKRAV